MSLNPEWIETVIKARLAETRVRLRELDEGAIHTGERFGGGPYIDTTKRTIDRMHADIRLYEEIIAAHEAREV